MQNTRRISRRVLSLYTVDIQIDISGCGKNDALGFQLFSLCICTAKGVTFGYAAVSVDDAVTGNTRRIGVFMQNISYDTGKSGPFQGFRDLTVGCNLAARYGFDQVVDTLIKRCI